MKYNFDEIVSRENTLSYKYDFREKIFVKADVIPMWIADMDFKTPPFVIDAIRKRLEHEILGYSYVAPSCYHAVAAWNKRHHNWDVNPDWIRFSPGVVPALNLLVMAFTQPGDKIIIQPPVYFPFFSAVTNHQRMLLNNPLRYEHGHYSIDYVQLEAGIDDRTRMLILCNPHNPTGNVWSTEDLEHIGEICLNNNILLVSDEIHADLVYSGNKHTPAASISNDMALNTITCMSPSKTFNLAGLSTAYVIIPDSRLRMQYEKVLNQVHVGAGNIFGFVAMEAAYSHGDDWLKQLMEYLEGNLMFLQEFIRKHMPVIKVIQPQATYLIWLDCSGLKLAHNELKSFMINKAGVGFNDGLQFGSEGKGFHRINIACPRSLLYKALLKMQEAIDKYFEK
jgi:cystathionine beta-lyase